MSVVMMTEKPQTHAANLLASDVCLLPNNVCGGLCVAILLFTLLCQHFSMRTVTMSRPEAPIAACCLLCRKYASGASHLDANIGMPSSAKPQSCARPMVSYCQLIYSHTSRNQCTQCQTKVRNIADASRLPNKRWPTHGHSQPCPNIPNTFDMYQHPAAGDSEPAWNYIEHLGLFLDCPWTVIGFPRPPECPGMSW